jgi:hypothetical protein
MGEIMDINLFELQDALDAFKEKGIKSPTMDQINDWVKEKRNVGSKTTTRKSTRGKRRSNK